MLHAFWYLSVCPPARLLLAFLLTCLPVALSALAVPKAERAIAEMEKRNLEVANDFRSVSDKARAWDPAIVVYLQRKMDRIRHMAHRVFAEVGNVACWQVSDRAGATPKAWAGASHGGSRRHCAG